MIRSYHRRKYGGALLRGLRPPCRIGLVGGLDRPASLGDAEIRNAVISSPSAGLFTGKLRPLSAAIQRPST